MLVIVKEHGVEQSMGAVTKQVGIEGDLDSPQDGDDGESHE
jgi:hypothetical protein